MYSLDEKKNTAKPETSTLYNETGNEIYRGLLVFVFWTIVD